MRFFRIDNSEQQADDDDSGKTTMCKRVFNLINKEKWDKILKLLKGKHAREICEGKDPTGLSVLGMSVGSNPPLSIVQQILKTNPSLSLQPDNFGALPIHLACLNGASASVIRYLIQNDNGTSVMIADEDKRIPLHHAVEFSARLDIQENSSSVDLNSDSQSSLSSYSNFEEDLDIIRELCRAAPELVIYTDKNGDTPLDVAHVIKGLAHTSKQRFRINKVYAILRDCSIQVYKKKKRGWEYSGYRDHNTHSGDLGTSGSTVNSSSNESISDNSKSINSDRSNSQFVCSEQDPDLMIMDPERFQNNLILNKFKMNYFGFRQNV